MFMKSEKSRNGGDLKRVIELLWNLAEFYGIVCVVVLGRDSPIVLQPR